MVGKETDGIDWYTLAQAYAFIGNSLLAPMTQTESVGLDPGFWEAFPTFCDADVADAASACKAYATRVGGVTEKSVRDAALEYTRLFIGPPTPAAAPWETMYASEDVTVGFGQATFAMRSLLREAGLEVRNENNQYEDHLGIELLYLSELCRRQVEGEAGDAGDLSAATSAGDPAEASTFADASADDASAASVSDSTDDSLEASASADDASAAPVSDPASVTRIAAFMDAHPLSWVGAFRARVAEAFPDGYFVGLLGVTQALLAFHRKAL